MVTEIQLVWEGENNVIEAGEIELLKKIYNAELVMYKRDEDLDDNEFKTYIVKKDSPLMYAKTINIEDNTYYYNCQLNLVGL